MFFTFLGSLSMEIYLLFEKIAYLIEPLICAKDPHQIILNTAALMLTIVFAIILHQVNVLVTKSIKEIR